MGYKPSSPLLSDRLRDEAAVRHPHEHVDAGSVVPFGVIRL
jgi:hypothetical protein